MSTQNEIRQSITDQIIAALVAGTAPWRRPWATDANAGAPANAFSGKRYSGVNPLLLQIAADCHGFKSRYWATYRQWQDLGGQVVSRPSHVRSGEWGSQIVFCKPCTKTKSNENGDETVDQFWMLRSFTVFNADQVSGDAVDKFRVGNDQVSSTEIDQRFQRADEVIEATGADIRFGGNQAVYHFTGDFIELPRRQQFALGEFYETAFHELAHWTEHPSRLNWDRKEPENTYALGELIAELASVYISGELGLPVERTFGNHASYIQHWIAQMKGDSRYIFKATSQATKAADFIMSFSRPSEAEVESEESLVA